MCYGAGCLVAITNGVNSHVKYERCGKPIPLCENKLNKRRSKKKRLLFGNPEGIRIVTFPYPARSGTQEGETIITSYDLEFTCRKANDKGPVDGVRSELGVRVRGAFPSITQL